MKNMVLTEAQDAQVKGLEWLAEMEAISSPTFANAIILNIYRVSKRINDVQIVCDTINKRMLVWVDLDWWGNKFNKPQIEELIINLLRDVLPTFEVRVVYDQSILEKSLKLLGR